MSRPPHNLVADRYRLVSTIGEGGMGRVWHAHDELLGRDVAVKEITPEGLTRTELGDLHERTIREARAIAQISHPSVVRIFDVVTDGGTPWIVMELIWSQSLQAVLEHDGPLTPPEAARIGLAVLAGLRAAHRVGILHRDVKPANVLLTEDGRVVLTDFGLAVLAGDSSMTRTGVVLGSPSYLAPERGLDEPDGAQADLWSLGATLYAAIEGRPPYQKSHPMATLTALLTEPPPVSERAGVLGPVLAALLVKDPQERADVDETERLLREALAGGSPTLPTPLAPPVEKPATVEPLTAEPPVSSPSKRRPRWLIPAVVALVLAGGVAVARPFTPVASAGAPTASASSVPMGSAGSAGPATPSRPVPGVTAGGPAGTAPSVPGRSPSAPAPAQAPAAVAPPASSRPPAAPRTTTPTPPVAAPATKTAAVGSPIWNHGTSTCLHLPGRGREVQLWACDGSDNQKFDFPGDGTLRVLGQCVQATSTGTGARLRGARCTGSAQQRFVLNAAQDLILLPADKCVDVPDWSSANGVPAQIWTCAGTDNQKWN
ncbi:protein kinase [Actinoplanes sp. TRM 88003]|uniref:non-specific serine/threonine protein kinase n=1 Tax=Paractinoplanes aksuensis TaxID=2939490 RepID=A0ABT1DY48_9ACTN|nr:protein kinase [Actinoplanes aksuensis]MCO8275518.1 protein kinase [Actinoplanes aksuensis]